MLPIFFFYCPIIIKFYFRIQNPQKVQVITILVGKSNQVAKHPTGFANSLMLVTLIGNDYTYIGKWHNNKHYLESYELFLYRLIFVVETSFNYGYKLYVV